jgi:hypothetical protein
MTNSDDQVAIDFEAAHFGHGTRCMPLADARRLLEYCKARQCAFQTTEAFEVFDGREILTLEYSILGLSDVERSASSAADLHEIGRRSLDKAAAQPNPYIFKIWVDTIDNILFAPLHRRRMDKSDL